MDAVTSAKAESNRRRIAILATLYGLLCHVTFVAGVGTMMVVLHGGMVGALGDAPAPWSWLFNAALLLQFPLLHTALLSRRGTGFMRRLVPGATGVPLLSTTYALIASLQTAALFLGWTPSGHIWWQAHGPLLIVFEVCNAAAWLLLGKAILDAGMGLQTGFLGWWAVVRGRRPVYPAMPTRGLFRWCRQPIYVAFALTLWTPPTKTPDGLIVALVLTSYCVIGPLYKEARFSRRFGLQFAAYQAATPYWLPWPRPKRPVTARTGDAPEE